MSGKSDGPTWWTSAEIPLTSTTSTKIFTLFEYFPHNAEPYANLRVSASDVTREIAYDRAFSTDEITTHYRSGSDPSKKLRETLDCKDEHSSLACSINDEGLSIVLSSVKVEMKVTNMLSRTKFLDRVMRYLMFVNMSLSDIEQEKSDCLIRKNEIERKLKQSLICKNDFDKRLRKGTGVLMNEKRKHEY